MNNIKIYKTAGYFAVYFWAVALSFCGPMIFLLDILASPLIPNAIPMILLISIYIALTLWKLTKALKRAMRRVCFVKEGIVTIERKNQFMPWEQFSHAYFCVDDRNWPYLLLANKEVSKKQTIKMLKPTFLKEVMRDGTVCMRLATLKPEEREQIKQIVTANIPNIIEYKPKKWLFD